MIFINQRQVLLRCFKIKRQIFILIGLTMRFMIFFSVSPVLMFYCHRFAYANSTSPCSVAPTSMRWRSGCWGHLLKALYLIHETTGGTIRGTNPGTIPGTKLGTACLKSCRTLRSGQLSKWVARALHNSFINKSIIQYVKKSCPNWIST